MDIDLNPVIEALVPILVAVLTAVGVVVMRWVQKKTGTETLFQEAEVRAYVQDAVARAARYGHAELKNRGLDAVRIDNEVLGMAVGHVVKGVPDGLRRLKVDDESVERMIRAGIAELQSHEPSRVPMEPRFTAPRLPSVPKAKGTGQAPGDSGMTTAGAIGLVLLVGLLVGAPGATLAAESEVEALVVTLLQNDDARLERSSEAAAVAGFVELAGEAAEGADGVVVLTERTCPTGARFIVHRGGTVLASGVVEIGRAQAILRGGGS